MMSTSRARQASTMSWPLVHKAVPEPCHVSPPSNNKEPGRLAFIFLTKVAK